MSCEEFWVTAAGDRIKVQDMTEQHAKNALNMLLRKQREFKEELQQSFDAQFYRAAGETPEQRAQRLMIVNSSYGKMGTTTEQDVNAELQKFMHDQDFFGTKGASQ